MQCTFQGKVRSTKFTLVMMIAIIDRVPTIKYMILHLIAAHYVD